MPHLITLANICFLALGISGQGIPQRLNFYNNTDGSCSNSGLLTTILKSDDTLITNSDVNKANAINLVGMWRIYEEIGNETGDELFYSKDERTCNKREEGHSYTKAEMFGGLYQTEREITFFTEERFGGIKYVSPIDALAWDFQQPISVQSFLFTGTHKWTVYDNTNFTGIATCFSPDMSKLNQYGEGITYILEARITVGSVKEGCAGEDGSSRVGRPTATFVLIVSALLLSK